MRVVVYMKERLLKLITVKSIVTLCLTVIHMVLAIRGTLPVENVIAVYSLVLGSLLRNKSDSSEHKNDIEDI